MIRTLLNTPLRLMRFLAVSVTLALGQVWANKTRSVLATLGIVIGIASVTAVIGALEGLKTKVLDEFQTFGTNKLFIASRWPEEGPKRDAPWRVIRLKPSDVAGLLQHAPSVEAFTRITSTGVPVTAGDETLDNASVIGIDPAWHDIENRAVTAGRPFSVVDETNARPVCLVTEQTRDELRLPTDPTGEAVYLLNRRFTVIGVVEDAPGGGMFGGGGQSNEVFVPFNTMYRASAESYMYVIANAKSPVVADEARAEVRFYLRRTRNLAPDEPDTFRIEVMSQYIEQFNQLAAGVTAVAGGIVSVSLLVGGIGIMNIMLVSVSERTREIGLRKAVGARPAAILLQFLIESIVLCTLGGLLGVLGGQLMIAGIARIPDANLDQAAIPAWAVVLSLAFSSAVGVGFGLFPAIKASRLHPIDALRHE